ncbi:sporulation membrane protein YtaF [Ornithinibacillus sp. BX22]|uniref:Sporulation membrane protein YtaF n=2 Tax=Ornithinibacillus TaxID=484508 RepID=A0A923L6Z6_9BACI|nr:MULTISPECIES: sporulation membrane protein YtaF [Ornithinibacillus]MBC5637677.1 sporulation membrane protein YtaF [Ornithinibacillus hominis]MBS3681648.1 sporulation membrane protein YtaF [Ornithinibacillus massiliensis]
MILFYTGLLFLVIAVSLDGFGVGITYGMRRIVVPKSALFIIMMCSGVVVLLSMLIGTVLNSFLSVSVAETIGGVILIVIGLFSLINIIRNQLKQGEIDEEEHQATTAGNFQSFRTVIAKPDKADLDRSGTISLGEATLLGTALALDAFGAGIGAAILGYSPFITPVLIAIMSGVFVHLGIKVGVILSKNKRLERMNFLPPILLITLGVLNLI